MCLPGGQSMRMRKKPNLDARMLNCADLQEKSPEENRGRWHVKYPDFQKICLEIGCGKGRFTIETAKNNPEILLVAIETVQSAMVMAMERAVKEGLKNIVFIDTDAAKLRELFAPGEVDRIYINFCDPWPKSRDAKFRLTAPAFLRSYADLLPCGGELQFKTDNTPLFDWSEDVFRKEGWRLKECSRDLHENGPAGVMTDYEAKFYSEGIKIKRLVAEKDVTTKDSSAGIPPRLRNAALSDARNC